MHEKQMHKYSCVVTLTYNDSHLPKDLSLNYYHFQRFIRRLRKALHRKYSPAPRDPAHRPGAGEYSLTILHHAEVSPTNTTSARLPQIRYYMGGEYGEQHGRPHYHAALFGIDFADRIYFAKSPAGTKIYTSPTLEKLWPLGFSSIGDVNFSSAAYIARYIMKKRTGDGNKTHYQIVDLETGELHTRRKEFNQMSRKPGLGRTWLEKYQTDAYPHGKVVVKGHQVPTPRYYDKIFADLEPLQYEQLQYVRYVEQIALTHEHTDARLAVQEQVAKAKHKSLRRKI